MKPVTFTADPNLAVGAPWEISRSPTDRQSWIYTVTGGLGLYSSSLALLPDYEVGFTVLAAGTGASTSVDILSKMLPAIFVPALEIAAREEAQIAYAGTYGLAGVEGANSILTVVADDQKPGLGVTRWFNNGTDILQLLGWLRATDGQTEGNISVRLYPTGLQSKSDSIKKVSWRAVYDLLSAPSASGTDAGNCDSWCNVDGLTYGGVGIDEFVFELDRDGKATSVEPRALRSKFPKSRTGNGAKLIRDGLRPSAGGEK